MRVGVGAEEVADFVKKKNLEMGKLEISISSQVQEADHRKILAVSGFQAKVSMAGTSSQPGN